MTHIMKRFFVTIFLSTTVLAYAAVVVHGTSDNVQGSFDFEIADFCGSYNGSLFVTASESGAGSYAVAYFDHRSSLLQPLATEQATVDGLVDQENPLFDKAVPFLSMMTDQFDGLVAVTHDEHPQVFFVETAAVPHVRVCPWIYDARGDVAGAVHAVQGSTKARAFIAVSPQGGDFGNEGSGIAVCGTQKKSETVMHKDEEITRMIVSVTSLPFAAPCDMYTSAFAHKAPLQTMAAPVSLCWEKESELLYIGTGLVQAAPLDGAGACSVAVAANDLIVANSLEIRSIFDFGFDFSNLGSDGIIVAPKDQELSVHHLEAMRTTTNKQLLIVCGGNGKPEKTAHSVYAIPLVASGNYRGLVASKYDTTQCAKQADDLVTIHDLQALVGCGPLHAGPIKHLSVRGEVVYATVADGAEAGVYCSRALLDAYGEVKSWTVWKRATPFKQPVHAASHELYSGTLFMLTEDERGQKNSIVRTQWSNEYDCSYFSLQDGGVHSVKEIVAPDGAYSSLYLTTLFGKDRLQLSYTDDLNGKKVTYKNGIIDESPYDVTTIGIEGGGLAAVGPLTTATIACSKKKSDSWVCVGGSRGVAVLQHPDGHGMGARFGRNFSSITAGMSFVPFGSYRFVKKLIADNNWLYIVTDTHIDRINLDDRLHQQNIQTVLRADQCGSSSISDVVISGSLGIVATRNGLFITKEGTRVYDENPQWVQLPLPEGYTHINSLQCATYTGKETDITKHGGGHLYVLSGSRSTRTSRVNRISVAEIKQGAPVASDTVQPFVADMFLKNTPSYFIDYGAFVSAYATDGAFTIAFCDKVAQRSAVVVPLLKCLPQSGFRFVGARSRILSETLFEGALVSSLVQNSTGVWMIAGTTGVYTNE